MQAERGCHDKPPVPMQVDGEDLTRCPRRPLLDNPDLFLGIFDVYSWYQNGHFPETGTWQDQPAAFVECISILDKAVAEAKKQKEAIDAGRASRQPQVQR